MLQERENVGGGGKTTQKCPNGPLYRSHDVATHVGWNLLPVLIQLVLREHSKTKQTRASVV